MRLKGKIKKAATKLFKGGSDGAATSPINTPQSNINPGPMLIPVATAPLVAPAPPTQGSSGVTSASNDAWPNLTAFLDLLNQSTPFAPLKPVLGNLQEFARLYENHSVIPKEYEDLRAELEDLFRDLHSNIVEGAPPVMTASMLSLCRAIQDELANLAGNHSKNTISRYLRAERDFDGIMGCYRRIRGQFERLRLNASLNALRIADRQATDARLASIAPSMSACYNSAEAALIQRRTCTPGTREQVLLDLQAWKNNQGGQNVCWISGMAGTGKTTIATTLCSVLEQDHELGASFFCTRLLPECRNVKLIFPTIAYQLARFSGPFQEALSQALERDPDIHTKALQVQFQRMILDPLQAAIQSLPANIVVVIDALDECEDRSGVKQMLDLLFEKAPISPIKIVVSSRPEPHVRERVKKSGLAAYLTLHELEDKLVRADIEAYIREELALLSVSLTDVQLETLVERAGVLFIYAATAVRYIGSGNSSVRLDALLNMPGSGPNFPNKTREIDNLYDVVLAAALNNLYLERSEKMQIELVLRTVVCAQEPLTVTALAGLLELSIIEVQMALRPLWSVLHVSESSATHRISPLHVSFSDYMLDPTRSNQFSWSPIAHHGKLAELCFNRIEQNPIQFNIGNLQSSYVLDEDVPNIKDRVKRAITLDLLYACRYWANHLELGGQSASRGSILGDFLSKRLLLWMEILNLTKIMDEAIRGIEKAISWVHTSDCSHDTKQLVQDVRRFVSTFAASPVSQSTPHLYISMLSSWPGHQPIGQLYRQRTTGLVDIKGLETAERQPALLSTIPVPNEVICVAFSPDGLFFTAGTLDGKIFVWDALGCRMTIDPIKAHAFPVQTIAISPDGAHVCSGSRDGLICVWDPRNGRIIKGPLEGHTGGIHSVDYSPNGLMLASGSGDETVCIWDAQNGQLIGSPLQGNDGAIQSVAFSPDGAIIAAGSESLIHTWDPRSGELVGDPLKGHSNRVRVAFPPNGKCLISASGDGVMQVWDIVSRQVTFGPCQIHPLGVETISISPNGAFLATGSQDCTIKLWHTETRKSHLTLWHNNCVESVAFSPDGMRLVSGSQDSVCVWDIRGILGHVVKNRPMGHSDWVRSVIFSPCGTHIISGSDDNTIRIWDRENGQPVCSPLLGHNSRVLSVACSSDGKHIFSVSDDRKICIWNQHSGDLEKTIGPIEIPGDCPPWYREYWPASFFPHGDRLVCGSYSGHIYTWDSGRLSVSAGHRAPVSSIAFSPNGQFFVTGSWDRTLLIWDANNGKLVSNALMGHVDRVHSVVYSPNNSQIASASEDTTIRLWDSKDGPPKCAPLQGHTAGVYSIVYSPDATQLVSGSDDASVRIWDVSAGQSIALFEGHTNRVCSVAFSPDGTQIASASGDMAIRLWDASARYPLQEMNISGGSILLAGNSYTQDWRMHQDGWVYNIIQSQRLIWLPPDVRNILLWPQNTSVISRRGCVELDFSQAMIGDRWVQCYQPL